MQFPSIKVSDEKQKCKNAKKEFGEKLLPLFRFRLLNGNISFLISLRKVKHISDFRFYYLIIKYLSFLIFPPSLCFTFFDELSS